ncbi:hypothetical protein F4Y19_09015 [Candidatus Poribacteria bacterium]|nr:hypothetical protein [Candidatus Poribacteria bacterium]
MINYLYDKKAFASQQWFTTDEGMADWQSLPKFSFQPVEVSVNLKRALPDVSLLLMINVLLFIVIFLIFVKTEV